MFTTEQLEAIKYAAGRVEGGDSKYGKDERAVVSYLISNNGYFKAMQWVVVKYCAEECKRQRSGEMSVYDMVNAWNWVTWARDNGGLSPLTTGHIEQIGRIVEPIDNKNGFRTIPIFIENQEKLKAEFIERQLELLLDDYYSGNMEKRVQKVRSEFAGHTAISKNAEDQFYYEYETIHPFRDGNGRSGKILYNYLKGTLDNPIMPPNFWGGSNP